MRSRVAGVNNDDKPAREDLMCPSPKREDEEISRYGLSQELATHELTEAHNRVIYHAKGIGRG